MSERNQNLFSYGTLQKDSVQLDLFGRLLNGEKDTLKGHKFASVEITDKAFLANGEEKIQSTLTPTANENDIIYGTVFEVSGDELLLADDYEPIGFKRIEVDLESGKSTWIYVLAATL